MFWFFCWFFFFVSFFFSFFFFLFALLGIGELQVHCNLWSTIKILFLYFFKLLHLTGDFIFIFNKLFSWISCYSAALPPAFPLQLFVRCGYKIIFSFTDLDQSILFWLIHLQGFLFVYLKSVWLICCVASWSCKVGAPVLPLHGQLLQWIADCMITLLSHFAALCKTVQRVK